MKKINIKTLNNKGFAVSIILYIGATIVVLVLLLVLSILSTNNKNKDNIVDNIKQEVSGSKDEVTIDALGKVSISASDNVASGLWHKDEFSLIFNKPTQDGITVDYPVTYYYGFSRSGVNISVEGNELPITESTRSTIYYIKACRSGTNNVCSPINSYEVKLDKDKPNVEVSGTDTKWTSSKTLKLTSSAISGISYYEYFVDNYEEATISDDQVLMLDKNEVVIEETGKYIFIRAINGVGNKGDWHRFDLCVDSIAPEIPEITATDGKISGEWHGKDVKLELTGSFAISGVDYYYSLNSKEPNDLTNLASIDKSGNGYINFKDEVLDIDVAIKACNKASVCSAVEIYRMRIDKKIPSKPTVEGGNTTWSTSPQEFTITSKAGSISGVAYYEYYISLFDDTPATDLPATDTVRFTTTTISVNTPGRYIFFREVSNAGNKSAWVRKDLCITTNDIPTPTLTATDGKISGEWHNATFTLQFTNSLLTVPLVYYHGTNESSLANNNYAYKKFADNTAGITYYVKACLKSDKSICSDVASYTVLLDKDLPKIAKVATNNGVSLSTCTNTKTLVITPTAVSGVHHYEYAIATKAPTEDTEGIKTFTDNTITINDTGKLIFIRAVNNLGAVGGWKQVNLYVDSAVPASPTVTAGDKITTGNWHLKDVTLTPSGSTALSGIVYYYSTTSPTYDSSYTKMPTNSTTNKQYIKHTENTSGTNYYIVACNKANTKTCSPSTLYQIKLDKTTLSNPTVTGDVNADCSWSTNSYTFTVTSNSSTFSGFSHFEYYLSNSKTAPAAKVEATGIFTGNTATITTTTPGRYVYFREVNVAGRKSSWANRKQVCIDGTIPNPIITANDGIESGKWHKANTTLSFTNTLTSVPLEYKYYTTDSTQLTTASSKSITSNSNLTFHVKACRTGTTNCSGYTEYHLLLDKSTPEVSSTGHASSTSNWTASKTLTLSALKKDTTDSLYSGVDYFEYYLSDTAPTATTEGIEILDSSNKTNATLTITGSHKYIYVRVYSISGKVSEWKKISLFVDSKVPGKVTITAADEIESGQWHTAATQLNLLLEDTETIISGIKYYYSTTSTEEKNTDNPKIVATDDLLKNNTAGNTIYVKACNGASVCGEETSYTYKLDKASVHPEAPTITYDITNTWNTEAKQYQITPPESTSGISHYEYHITNSNSEPDPTDYNTVEITGTLPVTNNIEIRETGKYIYFRAVNNVGTLGKWTAVKNLFKDNDIIAPPTITATDGKLSGEWHTAAARLDFSATSASGVTYYYNTTSPDSEFTELTTSYIKADNALLKNNTVGTTLYVKACNLANVCSDVSEYVYKLDKQALTAPGVSGGDNEYVTDTVGRQFVITSKTTSNPVSGIKGYEYYIGKETSITASKVATGFIESNTTTTNVTIKEPGQYIYFREVSNAGKVSAWTARLNLYVEYANYPEPVLTISDGILSGEWHQANTTISLDAGITTIPVNYYYYTNTNSTEKEIASPSSFTIGSSTVKTVNAIYYFRVCRDTAKQHCSDYVNYDMKLDKTAPSISLSGVSSTWSSSKTITLTPTSFSGINYYEYYISNDTTAPTGEEEGIVRFTGNTLNISQTGQYIYFRAADNAGKISAWTTKQNLYVDTEQPNPPTITATDGVASDKWHVAKTTLNFSTDSEPLSGITYKYRTSSDSTEKEAATGTLTISTATTGTTYYVKACNLAGVCSNETSYKLRIDLTKVAAPGVTYADEDLKNKWTINEKTFVLTPPTGVTVDYYEYYISNNSSETPSQSTLATGNSESSRISIGTSGTYIYFRVVLINGREGNWTAANNLYINTAFLDNLVVEDFNLSPGFVNNTLNYSITVPYDITSISIDATADSSVSVSITNNDDLQVGTNNVYIVTQSIDSTATYVIEVTRLQDSTNTLSNLDVGGYTLEPDFDPEITNYTVSVEGLSLITIDAVPTSDVATVEGNGEVLLSTGANVVYIKVKAADGTTNSYTITITNTEPEE